MVRYIIFTPIPNFLRSSILWFLFYDLVLKSNGWTLWSPTSQFSTFTMSKKKKKTAPWSLLGSTKKGFIWFLFVNGLECLILKTKVVASMGHKGSSAQLFSAFPYLPASVLVVVIALIGDRLQLRGPMVLMLTPVSMIGCEWDRYVFRCLHSILMLIWKKKKKNFFLFLLKISSRSPSTVTEHGMRVCFWWLQVYTHPYLRSSVSFPTIPLGSRSEARQRQCNWWSDHFLFHHPLAFLFKNIWFPEPELMKDKNSVHVMVIDCQLRGVHCYLYLYLWSSSDV